MNTIQSVVSVAALIAIAYSACPKNWRNYGGKCYRFETEIEDWPNARQMCRMHNSDLVVIETEAEQNWIRKQARAFNQTDQDDGFWLGGTDWNEEDKWVWEPTGQSISYIVWGQGQPNNRNGSEDCLATMKYFDYIWSDEFCNWVRLGYICEMPESAAPIVGTEKFKIESKMVTVYAE